MICVWEPYGSGHSKYLHTKARGTQKVIDFLTNLEPKQTTVIKKFLLDKPNKIVEVYYLKYYSFLFKELEGYRLSFFSECNFFIWCVIVILIPLYLYDIILHLLVCFKKPRSENVKIRHDSPFFTSTHLVFQNPDELAQTFSKKAWIFLSDSDRHEVQNRRRCFWTFCNI